MEFLLHGGLKTGFNLSVTWFTSIMHHGEVVLATWDIRSKIRG